MNINQLPLDREEQKMFRQYISDQFDAGLLPAEVQAVTDALTRKFGQRYEFDFDTVPSQVRQLAAEVTDELRRYSITFSIE